MVNPFNPFNPWAEKELLRGFQTPSWVPNSSLGRKRTPPWAEINSHFGDSKFPAEKIILGTEFSGIRIDYGYKPHETMPFQTQSRGIDVRGVASRRMSAHPLVDLFTCRQDRR